VQCRLPGDKAAKSLLASCIPQLQPHRTIFQVHRFRQKVDPDRGLPGAVRVRGKVNRTDRRARPRDTEK
jgi:hypothetical protein